MSLWTTKPTKTLTPSLLKTLTSTSRHLSSISTASESESPSSSFTFSPDDDKIHIKAPKTTPYSSSSSSSVSMPTSFMTGSIVGQRFYDKVNTKQAEDGNGWSVMLDYRTLKTPSKKSLKCPTLALAKAIAAEWEYQQTDGIRPYTMPLMKLACTALERVPLTRPKIIENLMKKFHQDLVFCRAPKDNDHTRDLRELQVEKFRPLLKRVEAEFVFRPLLKWIEAEFGFRPVVYTSIFGGKQKQGLVNAMQNLLKKTNDTELAAIDAIASATQSLLIAIGIFRGRLNIEQAIELISLEEDLQVYRRELVEGDHDVDIVDLRVQVSSATVFLGLSRKH